MDSHGTAESQALDDLVQELRLRFSSLSKEEVIELAVSMIVGLQAQFAELRTVVEPLVAEVSELQKKLDKRDPPSFVRPSTASNPSKPKIKPKRKQRPHSFSRHRLSPTHTLYHALDHCPDCQRILKNGWVHRTRQVIDLPEVSAKVIDHVIIGRHCGVCGKNWVPKVNLADEVVGKHGLGINLMSVIGYLRTICRLPVRTIQSLLLTLYGLKVSLGTVTATLHAIANLGVDRLQAMLDHVRGSPVKHGDETGWREAGQNGYIWSFSTPTVRYQVYNKSRAGAVPEEVLGKDVQGVLVCDFYGGYNGTVCLRQRCWVHFVRDLHKLKELYAEDNGVVGWANRVIDLYREAIAFQDACKKAPDADGHGPLARREKRRDFESRLSWLALPYLELPKGSKLPQSVLAERCDRFAQELFLFTEHLEVPSENNAAERAIRPAVIARKISGGTRSASGSKTCAALMSLFGTWKLQQLNPWQECKNMLASPTAATS